jgi:hypothetical protein
MKVRLPITVLHGGSYLPPGTEIDLPDDEARSMVARFGICAPDETLSPDDLTSIEVLNRMHAIHG